MKISGDEKTKMREKYMAVDRVESQDTVTIFRAPLTALRSAGVYTNICNYGQLDDVVERVRLRFKFSMIAYIYM